MLIDSLQPDRDMILMLDGSWRAVPLVDEVAEHLQLKVRPFPDGRPRVSFSLRGLWSISSSTKLFPDWAKLPVSRLRDRSQNAFLASGEVEDIFVDAAEFLELAGGVKSQRLRAAIVLVNEARLKEAVDRRDGSEMVSILALSDVEARLRRIRQVYGEEAAAAFNVVRLEGVRPAAQATVDMAGDEVVDGTLGQSAPSDEARDETAPGQQRSVLSFVDIARYVPVIDRELNGRIVPTVRARDMHVFLGSADQPRKWFLYQAKRCKLVEGVDYVEFNTGKIPSDPKRGPAPSDFIVSLSGAKEIGMVGSSQRSKDLRLYFIDCETRVYAGSGPPPGVVLPMGSGDNQVARSTVRSSDLRRVVSPVRCYLPVGPDHGLTADTLPMTLYDFLVYSMIPEPYARKIAPGLEQQLCGDVLKECVLNGAAKLCTDGRTFFARSVLRAWWEMNADDLIGNMGDECPWVFSRGLVAPQ